MPTNIKRKIYNAPLFVSDYQCKGKHYANDRDDCFVEVVDILFPNGICCNPSELLTFPKGNCCNEK